MKKFSTFLCMVLCSIALHAKVLTGTCGDNLTWSYDIDTKAITIEGTGDMSYDAVPWEQVSSDLLSVSLPEGLTSIGESAFKGCSSLTSITLPNSVTSIGGSAFYGCTSLTKTNYTGDIASWCNIQFTNYTANPISFSKNLYLNDVLVTDLVIPQGVIGVGDYAFDNCSSLTSVTLPNSVKSIGVSAFYGCSSLTSVTIPNSVTSIGDDAFIWCSSLTSITIPNSVTSIGGNAFSSCAQVTVECTTPPTIESNTFKSDATISVPCFTMSVYLATPVWQFLSIVDDGTYRVNLSATEGGKATITATDCDANTATIEATGDECSHFVQWSDGNTDNPRTLNLTQDTTLVATFAACDMGGKCGDNLTWSYDTDTKALTIEGSGVMTDYEYDNQPWAQVKGDILSVSLPEGLASIGDGAFWECSSLTSIILPNSVTSIGDRAFSGCSSLTSIILPNSLTSIEHGAFADCSSLTSIILPNSLTSIGSDAFWGCSSLTSITIPNSVTSIGGSSLFCDCSSLTSVTLGNSVTSIGDCTFRHCSALTSITIPNSVTSIGWAAFEGCSSLTSVIIGNSVTSIGDDAFWYCTALTSVTLGNSVTSIGYLAFGNCPLTSITLPNSVTSIEDGAFLSCSQVTVECTTPPTIESNTFKSDASIFVPCSAFDTYLQTAVWQFLDLKGLSHTINLSATEGGKANITATDCDANTATIKATSDECMHFVQWSDGNTDNPRTLNLTQDTTLVAQFESTTYQINISAAEHGSLTYYGDPIDNIETTMTDCGGYGEWINNICAVPDEGYYFTGWSDGYADACRGIEVVSDTTLVAHFAEKQQVQVLVGVESACKNMGTVSGSGIFYQGDVVTITATPKSGYHFVEWSDGNSIANREIVLASDTTLFATFAAGDMGGKCGDNLTWSYDTDTKALTIEGTGAMTDYEYDNQPWAQVQGDILSVSLPEGLTSIGDGAFWECSALTSIILPNSVTTIGGDAFSGCSSLTSITFPNSVTSIGYGAFWHCSSLTSLTIPNSVTSIEGSTFGECYSLTSITIPNSVTSIGGYAFYNCSALTSVTLGNSVNSIGESAFYGCYSLTFITGGKCGDNLYWTWDNGALTITGSGDMDLKNHPAWWQYPIDIQSVSFPEAMTSISAYAFYGYNSYTVYQAPYSLKEAIIPANVTYIGYASFAMCPQLTKWQYNGMQLEVQYAEGYGYDVFNGDAALTFLQAPAELVEYRNNSWSNLDTLIVISGEIGEVPSNVRYLDLRNATNSTLRLNGRENLTTLYLPNGSTEIADKALLGCKHLGGILIPADVTRIGESAFEDCRSMDSVVFAGNKVEAIGDWAFYNCHSLRSLTLPECVEEIGRAAFFDCTYLNELTLPSTMKKIADNGFAGCEKLGTMYVNALVPPTIEAKTFEDVDRATPVFVPKGTLERYQADEYWSEFFNMAEYEAPTGNLNTAADNDANALRKVLRNGQVLILRGDKTYTILGEAL